MRETGEVVEDLGGVASTANGESLREGEGRGKKGEKTLATIQGTPLLEKGGEKKEKSQAAMK